jgi:uncharacterized protein YcbK (DUF882 family)
VQITQNFRSEEFACPCCGWADIDPRLVAGLQKLREALGKPIRINSGCRCARHNKRIGGAPKSQHAQGRAADISVAGMGARDLYAAARGLFSGYGVDDERAFLHVDTRDKPARWCYRGGRETAWREA